METSKKPSKYKWLFIVAIIIFWIAFLGRNSNGSSGPEGKSWMSQDGWTTFSFGDTGGESDNFLNYNKQLFDGMGNPIRHIHRTGTFKVEGNTIHLNFKDGQPPYKLEYKKVDGDWSVVDGSGKVYIWDDPDKRSSK